MIDSKRSREKLIKSSPLRGRPSALYSSDALYSINLLFFVFTYKCRNSPLREPAPHGPEKLSGIPLPCYAPSSEFVSRLLDLSRRTRKNRQTDLPVQNKKRFVQLPFNHIIFFSYFTTNIKKQPRNSTTVE